MLAETRRRRSAGADHPPGLCDPGRAGARCWGSPRARSGAIWRCSTWPARSSGRTAGRSTPARCGRCRRSTSGPARRPPRSGRSACGRGLAPGRRRHGLCSTAARRRSKSPGPWSAGGVQVVTNSLPIAQLLASSQQTDLILIGGYVYPRTGVALGPLAIATMQSIRVRKAILGAGGIVAEGIYNSNSLLVETERQMMSCGQEVMIVADHTKFGRLALARLCGLDEVDQVVVDSGLDRRAPGDARSGWAWRSTSPRSSDEPEQRGDSVEPRTRRRREDRRMSTLDCTHRRATRSRSWSARSSRNSWRNGARPANGRAASPEPLGPKSS